MHLNVVTFVAPEEEDDVIIDFDTAFTLVIAAAGIRNDIAITAIKNIFVFLMPNLFKCGSLTLLFNSYLILSELTIKTFEMFQRVEYST